MRIGVKLLPLACCAIEASLAIQQVAGASDSVFSNFDPDGSFDHHVLLVAGTVTKNAAAEVLAAWESLPEPKSAIAYGVCAISGGPYWDSYSVVPGVEHLLPVSAFVPGCPPPASTLLPVLQQLLGVTADA